MLPRVVTGVATQCELVVVPPPEPELLFQSGQDSVVVIHLVWLDVLVHVELDADLSDSV